MPSGSKPSAKTVKSTTPVLATNPKKVLSGLVEHEKVLWGWNADRSCRIAYLPVYYGAPESKTYERKGKDGKVLEEVEYSNMGELNIDTHLTDPETGEKIRITASSGLKNGRRMGNDKIFIRPVAEDRPTASKDEVPF